MSRATEIRWGRHFWCDQWWVRKPSMRGARAMRLMINELYEHRYLKSDFDPAWFNWGTIYYEVAERYCREKINAELIRKNDYVLGIRFNTPQDATAFRMRMI